GNRYKGQQRMAGGGSTIGSVISAGCPHSAYRSRRGRNRSPRDLGELTSPLVHGKHVRDGDSVVVGAWLASESSFSIVALTLGDRNASAEGGGASGGRNGIASATRNESGVGVGLGALLRVLLFLDHLFGDRRRHFVIVM